MSTFLIALLLDGPRDALEARRFESRTVVYREECTHTGVSRRMHIYRCIEKNAHIPVYREECTFILSTDSTSTPQQHVSHAAAAPPSIPPSFTSSTSTPEQPLSHAATAPAPSDAFLLYTAPLSAPGDSSGGGLRLPPTCAAPTPASPALSSPSIPGITLPPTPSRISSPSPSPVSGIKDVSD